MELIKPGTVIDFVSKMKVAYLISIALIVISFIFFLYHGGFNWGVEFIGGTEVHIKFKNDVTTKELRDILASNGYEGVSAQILGLKGDNEFILRFSSDIVAFEQIADFQKKLHEIINNTPKLNGAQILRIDYIGPEVGKELIEKALFAIAFGCVGILIYLMFRFEFAFALGAVIATLHDLVITLGAIVILDKEFTLALVAAVLTVIGYSVNDTIVIYDRIRENLRIGGGSSFNQLVNESVSQTLSRTTLTAFTTFIVLICLFLLGGSVIHDFAYTLIVGVVIGTYSSIFIASAFVVFWNQRKASK